MTLRQRVLEKVKRELSKWIGSRAGELSPLFALDRLHIAKQQRQSAPTQREITEALKRFHYLPTFSILTPVYNPPSEVLMQMLDSVLQQAYPHWELCLVNDASSDSHVAPILESFQAKDSRIRLLTLPKNRGIAGASNAALEIAQGEFICLVDHDDLILYDTLFELACQLNEWPGLDYIYTDSAIIDMQGQYTGFFFKPDFNWEMFLCHNWVGQLSTIRRSLVLEVGGWREGREGQDYDLFLRCFERTERIAHIPKILYHWRQAPASISVSPENKPRTQGDQRQALQECIQRLNIQGSLSDLGPFMFRIQRPLFNQSRVSLILCHPLRRSWEAVVEAVIQHTAYPDIEILFLMEDPPEVRYQDLGHARVHLLRYDPEQTLPSNLNQAAIQAEGYYLCFLFQEFEPLAKDWLHQLLEQAQRQEAGLVAGKLINRHHRIVSAGVVLSRLGPINLFQGEAQEAIGDTNSLISLRSYQLLSGNGAVIAAPLFQALEGFDPNYQERFFDYDLCLRLQAKGFINFYTPFATLQFKDTHPFYENHEWSGPDFDYFQQQHGPAFGKDGHWNLALQEAWLQQHELAQAKTQ